MAEQMSIFDYMNVQGRPVPSGRAAVLKPNPDSRASHARSAASKHQGDRLEDFGEKIGGARKDLWAAYGISHDAIPGMTDGEISKYAKKSYVWKTPDYAKEHEEGVPREVCMWQKEVKDALPSAPKAGGEKDYISVVSLIRDEVMDVKSLADLQERGLDIFTNLGLVRAEYKSEHYAILHYGGAAESLGYSLSKAVKASGLLIDRSEKNFERYVRGLGYDADRKGFLTGLPRGYEIKECLGVSVNREDHMAALQTSPFSTYYAYRLSDEEMDAAKAGTWAVFHKGNIAGIGLSDKDAATKKAFELAEAGRKPGKKRKKTYVPEPLKDVRREGGPSFRHGDVDGQDFLDALHIRGGEYGNWETAAERQANTNMAYDALSDLALALGIEPSDVSLDGRLGIGWGSRGNGARTGVAHYEPALDVINLTKMRGAGSLAHEWIHALDDIAGKELGWGSLIGRSYADKLSMPPELTRLFRDLRWKSLGGADAREELERKAADQEASIRSEIDIRCISKSSADEEELRKLVDQLVGKADGRTVHDAKPLEPIREQQKKLGSYGLYGHIGSDIMQKFNSLSSIRKMLEKPDSELAITVPTQFYRDACYLGGKDEATAPYGKDAHGYWDSDCEMLARAGAAWVKDRLAGLGIRDDYLCGHADCIALDGRLKERSISPLGKEREVIDKDFDQVVSALKERGLFHERTAEHEAVQEQDHFPRPAPALDRAAR